MKTPVETKFLIAGAMALTAFGGCGKGVEPQQATGSVPASWYQLPEEGGATASAIEVDPEHKLAPEVDNLLDAQSSALASLPPEAKSTDKSAPKDLVPWHMQAFMTDLSISGKGAIGSLIIKGNPAVSLIWMKKHDKPAAPNHALLNAGLEPSGNGQPQPAATVDFSGGEADLSHQLDGAIHAALATGQIRNETALREHLTTAAGNFRTLVRGLDANPGKSWWVSRFRMDVIVDASGTINPFVSVGGEVRLRFEWHRMKQKTAPPTPAHLLAARGPSSDPAKASFDELVGSIATDLDAVTRDELKETGFQGYTFRVGVGVTAGGTFGVVKGSATVLGQLYFSKDVAAPSLDPAAKRLDLAAAPAAPSEGTIAVIEDQPSVKHLRFAESSGIRYDLAPGRDDGAIDQVVYHVDRKDFRKGLGKAAGMASFFAKHASRVKAGSWGVYEMRASFDMSVGGNLGIATVNGLATAEIDLFNESF